MGQPPGQRSYALRPLPPLKAEASQVFSRCLVCAWPPATEEAEDPGRPAPRSVQDLKSSMKCACPPPAQVYLGYLGNKNTDYKITFPSSSFLTPSEQSTWLTTPSLGLKLCPWLLRQDFSWFPPSSWASGLSALHAGLCQG